MQLVFQLLVMWLCQPCAVSLSTVGDVAVSTVCTEFVCELLVVWLCQPCAVLLVMVLCQPFAVGVLTVVLIRFKSGEFGASRRCPTALFTLIYSTVENRNCTYISLGQCLQTICLGLIN